MKVGPYEVPGFAVGDALALLRELPDESIQCVVTSPPYWGLRSYGTPPTIWGGDEACAHEWGAEGKKHRGGPAGDSPEFRKRAAIAARNETADRATGAFCSRCGAWRGELGLEPTPELYVAHLVEVFREVRRVLRKDGTLWLNLGDSYATGGGKVGDHPGGGKQGERWKGYRGTRDIATAGKHSYRMSEGGHTQPNRMPIPGLKPKDLIMIPAQVALALRADGWYLRKDIIWAKPNPMPESTTDRPTSSHEHIFLFAKSERYYYDAEAIREKSDPKQEAHNRRYAKPYAAFDDRAQKTGQPGNQCNKGIHSRPGPGGRNARDVWTIATKPYRGAHFATFPPELPRRCIEAGSRGPGSRCDCEEIIKTPLGNGAAAAADPSRVTGRAGFNRPLQPDEGSRPITKREQRSYAEQIQASPRRDKMREEAGPAFAHYIRMDAIGARPPPPALLARWRSRGWLTEPPPCECRVEPGDVVLDPFCGSGTVASVAEVLGRAWLGFDAKAEYIEKHCAPRLAQRGLFGGGK